MGTRTKIDTAAVYARRNSPRAELMARDRIGAPTGYVQLPGTRGSHPDRRLLAQSRTSLRRLIELGPPAPAPARNAAPPGAARPARPGRPAPRPGPIDTAAIYAARNRSTPPRKEL